MDGKTVIFHGFKDEEILAMMRACKSAVPDADAAFATSTKTNLEWTLSELIEHVRAEHEEMKKR